VTVQVECGSCHLAETLNVNTSITLRLRPSVVTVLLAAAIAFQFFFYTNKNPETGQEKQDRKNRTARLGLPD
jgi:hypothetical protein